MAKFLLSCGVDEYVIQADLTQASAPILVDGDSTPYQTADCRHDRGELARLVAEWVEEDADDAELEEITAEWIGDADNYPNVIETVGTYIACCYGTDGDEPGECEIVIEQAESHGELAFRWVDRDDAGDHDTGDWSLDYDAVLAAAKSELVDRDETPDADEQIQAILDAGWFADHVDAYDVREIVDYCHSHDHLGQGHVIIDRDGRREWVTAGYVEHEAMYVYIPHGGRPWAAYATDVLRGCSSDED